MQAPWITTFFALALGSLSQAGSDGERAIPTLERLDDVSLLRLDGKETELSELRGEGVLVLAYTGVGCPISSRYAPRLSSLASRYSKRGVTFVGVNASPQDSREAIAKERAELRLALPVLRDVRQELTRELGAKTTTEVFVFDEEGTLRYRGAVDDQYSLGAAKPEPSENYLRDALDAVLADRAPEKAETEAPGCLLTLLPEEELPEAVTWSRDVAPIVQQNCEVCHRPGQVGPFPLQTYEQAQGWGKMIASVVAERRMPPWNASEEFDGHFVNQRSLTAKEREKIQKWVQDGMPRGNPKEDPAPRSFPEGWRIGEPDAVFQPTHRMWTGEPIAEHGFEVPTEGVVDYQFFVAKTDYDEDRWIQAMEIVPGAPDVVHHVLIGVHDPTKGPFRDDHLLSYLAVAVPGDTPSIFPEGYAKLLPKGASLVFQLHYTPNGKARTDISRLGVVFAEEPPIFEVVSEALIDTGIRIPAGAENHEVRGEFTFTEDTGILSFFPHMHTRGKDFRYVAHYPDGTSEDLLFSNYDFNWQESYIYEDPKLLPAGTRVECIAHYDNSDGNPNNPDPKKDVLWGDQTWEEMFVGYWDKVVPLDF